VISVIKGIFNPIPTPFVNDEISFEHLKANVKKYAETDLSGIVVLGSNGEFPYLTFEEKVQMIAAVRAELPSGKKVIAGTGCESTKETIQLTKEAAQAGADAVLVITPCYFKGSMNEAALTQHYLTVAENSPIPVLLYNMPGNSGINMSSKLVVKLSAHENITGVKDSSGNIVQIAEILAGVPADFSVFAGSGSFLLPSLMLGAVGGTLAVANVMPNECARIQKLFEQGNLEAAKAEQFRVLPVNAAVTAKYGVGGLKAAMDMLGYFGGEPRKPMLPLTDSAALADLRSILQKAGLIA
jgi:4-hydroxy-2-oxoglutarate aldolase